MTRVIDLNADLGEGFGPWSMGDDAAMLGIVTSANIACGGHAGDAETMFATLRAAQARGVVVGAHPGFADPAGFGRRVIPMTAAEIGRMVAAQVGALCGVAALAGVRVAYVKPHGALALLAARDREVASAICAALSPELELLAISGTVLEAVARIAGRVVHAEVFADRGYLTSGHLVPRGHPEALIHDPEVAVRRMVDFLDSGRMPAIDGPPVSLQAASICVHGDSPGAVALAQALRAGLAAAGVGLAPFVRA
ncbi:MAG: hypothetical protein RIT14_2871 [Pseudomonadota bacterium]